eukprot:CAMPEP_0176465740 /NCGR_PEP_ID=MMETSP0127-20121128/37474_1 /TAXON_ID=938130 /ORGANISM="Platyophrya macrostoma, Strain WH" /LENGTH=284 /DNA_ID=CAMNT_0017858769 /DNA_START=13 /DNA_END=867 /DNA_ORIENTATION=+
MYQKVTSAGVVAKGLLEYVHPNIANKVISKSVRQQMMELNGLVDFDKGLYHNQNYEELIKKISQSRISFRKEKTSNARKQIAAEEFKAWKKYVDERKQQLTEDFKITDEMKLAFKDSWDRHKERNTNVVKPAKILDVHSNFAKARKFSIPVDPRNLMRMVHPYYGYLSHFPAPFTFEGIMDIFEHKIVSGFENHLGQDLLASEIAAYTYWQFFDKDQKGYMKVEDFADFLQIFRITLEPKLETLKKEFSFALTGMQGEFSRDIPTNEEIVRFDLWRYIFLERNL